MLLVERGMPGFTITPMAHTMGCSGASHDLLTFEDVAVPVDNVLGQEGMGPEQLLAFLEVSRVFIAVAALGTAERSLGAFFGVGQAARHLRQADRQPPSRTGLSGRHGHGHLRTASHDPRPPWESTTPANALPPSPPMCKLCGLEAVGRVTDKALLVHGGLGYLKSSPIEMLYRDARLNWLEEGTPTIHKLIIARALLQEEFEMFGRDGELI